MNNRRRFDSHRSSPSTNGTICSSSGTSRATIPWVNFRSPSNRTSRREQKSFDAVIPFRPHSSSTPSSISRRTVTIRSVCSSRASLTARTSTAVRRASPPNRPSRTCYLSIGRLYSAFLPARCSPRVSCSPWPSSAISKINASPDER